MFSTLTARSSSATFDGTAEPSKIVLAYGPRRYFSNKKTRRFRAPAYRARSLFDAMATIANPADWLLTCEDAKFEPAVRALREILMLEANDYFAREDGHIVIKLQAGAHALRKCRSDTSRSSRWRPTSSASFYVLRQPRICKRDGFDRRNRDPPSSALEDAYYVLPSPRISAGAVHSHYPRPIVPAGHARWRGFRPAPVG